MTSKQNQLGIKYRPNYFKVFRKFLKNLFIKNIKYKNLFHNVIHLNFILFNIWVGILMFMYIYNQVQENVYYGINTDQINTFDVVLEDTNFFYIVPLAHIFVSIILFFYCYVLGRKINYIIAFFLYNQFFISILLFVGIRDYFLFFNN